ncbi:MULTISPECIES: YvrJ family protein [unclassified Clostridium]|uniref:YvrJ family protein n=1 Tax=unclassified Clostridium TaxID=2614128 RepID=UPI0002EF30B8|nr:MULTISPECIES: YvrJ family protein [unclassified Clostridium]
MVTLFTNVISPIAVDTYLLIRFESKIDELSQSTSELSAVVNKQLTIRVMMMLLK